jgi:hypothetical protein
MKIIIAGAAALLLAACGTTRSDRTLSGALIGGGVGLVSGGVGVAVGAVLGGGLGYFTNRDAIYLGEPLWDQ